MFIATCYGLFLSYLLAAIVTREGPRREPLDVLMKKLRRPRSLFLVRGGVYSPTTFGGYFRRMGGCYGSSYRTPLT